ncbi:MAG: HAD-IA family hydrolase [Chthoniobacteraceae bacterium]|nr:HAD-IA family hydrolase [Chthoniobacteraceae bacterium]
MTLQIPDGDFDGYVFDCDGTLADSMPVHYEAWVETLARFGCDFPEPYFYELGGVPTERIVEMLNEQQGLNMPPVEIARDKEALYIRLIPHITPIRPVVDFARRFHGKKPLAVASGGHRGIVRRTLTAIGIVDLFTAIVGAEDYAHGKPAPDPFLEAARQLGVDPARCLAFEDTALGIQSASSAGMATVRVPATRLPRRAKPATR